MQNTLEKFIHIVEPDIKPDILLAGDTKFGIVDSFLFEKNKPDKNDVYSNVKIILKSYDTMKELIVAIQEDPTIFDSSNIGRSQLQGVREKTINISKISQVVARKPMVAIAYKPVSDNYHYLLVRKLNLDANNLEKYMSLL
jgi:hypothetical protein